MVAMYQDIDSTEAVQAQRMAETGYTLTQEERDRMDKRHRFWAAITGITCLALLLYLATYPLFFGKA